MNRTAIEPLRHAVRHLVTAVSSAALYSFDHPQVSRLRGAALDNLTAALEAKPDISLVIIGDELLAGDSPLDTGLYVGRFVEMMRARGIGHVKFLRGVTARELAALAAALAGGRTEEEIRSTEHIRFGRVEVRFSLAGKEGEEDPLADFTAEEVARVTEIYEGVARNRKLHAAGIADMVGGFIIALREQARPLMALAPLRDMDEYTFAHSVNVCILNLAQAMSLGINGPLLQEIGIAGLLHDIGKMFVPREILTKPAQLTDAEWRIMRRHPHQGARCLIETPGMPHLAAVVTFEHHMKHDFSGYPAVPPGWRQSLASEMTSISDFFDALRTRRSYCDSMELRQIAGMLLDRRGREFHPLLTRNFLLILSRMMA